jgi:haloacetate dehalogenase
VFEGFSHRTINVGDAEIACVIGGSGPPLLLRHGLPQTKAMWAHVAPKLAANHTVVCADLRGYGDSSKPRCFTDKSNYSFRAGDQLNLMRALGFERFYLIGHDRGGRTGHRLALDHPDAVISHRDGYRADLRHVHGDQSQGGRLLLPLAFPLPARAFPRTADRQ